MEVRSRYKEPKKRITPGQYDLEFYRKYNYEESKHFKINHYPSNKKPHYFRWVYEDEPMLLPVNYIHNSRYKNVPTLKMEGKAYHATNRLRGVVESEGDVYYTVDNNTENRLDKISLMYYNSPIYYWIIAQANQIYDTLNVPRDTVLRIPPLNSVYGHYL